MTKGRTKLTHNDRIILVNQYLILEALYPEDAKSFKENRLIVENGYELHYDDLNPLIIESNLTADECREVLDILDMYWALRDSFSRLSDKSDIPERDVQFRGFDGNSGSGRLEYARFLVIEQNRWNEVLDGRPEFDFNSHSTVIDMYRRMLNKWISMGKKHDLLGDEIKGILDTQIHPDNRY